MPAYALGAAVPVVHPTAFVHPLACLIGDVVIGAGCYVGPFASLRGDMGRVELEEGSNLQDNCTMHCFPGQIAIIERDGHVGHGVTLHGCRVGRGALVGINAVVLDGAVVGERAFVGAQSLVTANTVVREQWLYTGTPARPVRALSANEMAWKANGTRVYQELARQTRAGLREVEPLTEVEADRAAPGMAAQAAVPLRAYRDEA